MGEPRGRTGNARVGSWLWRGVSLLVLAAVLAGAYFYWRRADHSPEPVAAREPARPVPVSMLTLREETVPMQMRFLGQTEASQTVEIRARVAGHLLERSFREGELVEQGQKLFQIDRRPFEVELAQSKARLASAEATQARAAQELRRYQRLAAREAATEDRVEQSQTEERVAAADVAMQQAQIAAVELQLQYTAIESPVTGRIGRALRDVGSYIAAGSEPLATVQQVDPMYVRYSVTEQEILRFRRGVAEGRIVAPAADETELQVTLADGSIYPLRGKINFLDVQIDLQTGTAVVRGTLPNPDGALIPGQFVHADPLGISRVGVLAVPQTAVRMSPTGASVFIVNAEDHVESRPVTLGEWSGDDRWIVESGLSSGERIVTDRLMQIQPGMPVTEASPQGPSADEDSSRASAGERMPVAGTEATP
ncbi:MAG: efflux RND transporter periplasmic adaptor subunit [Planctomycetaceae bacterium]